jgi:hypothetical protein
MSLRSSLKILFPSVFVLFLPLNTKPLTQDKLNLNSIDSSKFHSIGKQEPEKQKKKLHKRKGKLFCILLFMLLGWRESHSTGRNEKAREWIEYESME